MAVWIKVQLHGTIPSGEWAPIMQNYVEDTIEHIGREGVRRIRDYLPTQYMYLGNNGGTPLFNPIPPNAGYYESMIETHRARPDMQMITDSNVPYGPWLEGISDLNWKIWEHRRNPPPRRFKGYFTFRKITAQLQLDAVKIAQLELIYVIGELNA